MIGLIAYFAGAAAVRRLRLLLFLGVLAASYFFDRTIAAGHRASRLGRVTRS